MQTTTLNAPVVFQRHADFLRQAEEFRKAPGSARRRRRMAIVIGGRYLEDHRASQRGKLHRAGV